MTASGIYCHREETPLGFLSGGVLRKRERNADTMNQEFLIVSSVTIALRARQLLFSRQIPAKVEKIRHAASLHGCGYGVCVPKMYADTAAAVLASGGITVLERSAG